MIEIHGRQIPAELPEFAPPGRTALLAVDSTARSAGFLDYFPVVPRDCVASDNPELHRAGLLILEAYRAIVVDSGELVAVWSGPAGEPGPGRP